MCRYSVVTSPEQWQMRNQDKLQRAINQPAAGESLSQLEVWCERAQTAKWSARSSSAATNRTAAWVWRRTSVWRTRPPTPRPRCPATSRPRTPPLVAATGTASTVDTCRRGEEASVYKRFEGIMPPPLSAGSPTALASPPATQTTGWAGARATSTASPPTLDITVQYLHTTRNTLPQDILTFSVSTWNVCKNNIIHNVWLWQQNISTSAYLQRASSPPRPRSPWSGGAGRPARAAWAGAGSRGAMMTGEEGTAPAVQLLWFVICSVCLY